MNAGHIVHYILRAQNSSFVEEISSLVSSIIILDIIVLDCKMI